MLTPDPAVVPAALPIAQADPKPWFRSTTIWSGLGQIGLGLVVIVAAAFAAIPADWGAYGLTQVGLGVATLTGRVGAAQPIAPLR